MQSRPPPAELRVHAGLRPSDMTRKVTLCGATGSSGAAMALIMHFLRSQHEEHPQVELDKIVFTGLSALAMIKNASGAAHRNRPNPSTLRESFWTLLTLPSREVPITLFYRGEDDDGDSVFRALMHAIESNTAQWALSNGVSTANDRDPGEVRLPFVIPKAPGPQQQAAFYWEGPWRYLYIGEVLSNPTAMPEVQRAVSRYRHSSPTPTGSIPSPGPPAAAPPLITEVVTVQNLGLALFEAVRKLSYWSLLSDDHISQQLLVIFLARDLYLRFQYPNNSPHGISTFALGADDLVDGNSDEEDPLDRAGIEELARCGHRLRDALSDRARMDQWARNFADKYAGGGDLHIPGGQSAGVRVQVEHECRATIAWIGHMLITGIDHVIHHQSRALAQRAAAHASH